jgi:hypothetical protein
MTTPTTTPAQHTPTPWTIDSDGDGKPNAIITSTHDKDGPDDDVCEVYGGNADDDATRAANAAFIVAACNSHAQLLADVKRLREALAGLVDLSNDPAGSTFTLREVFGTFHQSQQVEGARARAALAATEGRT